MEEEFHELRRRVGPFTMTSVERMYALYKATEYVVVNRIAGDFVECGVWKGGSAMLMALALRRFGAFDRTIYLYDTFRGMSEPAEADRSALGESAPETWRLAAEGEVNRWCYAPLDEVRTNLATTGYPDTRLKYVEGKVEDTIPATLPERVALLRLDTDWYQSTLHELTHLFPRLAPGGILIVDDYGYWQGAKQAVDSYFKGSPTQPLLVRIDSTARLIIKS
jgi:predicted O-methyltransferase YrrM